MKESIALNVLLGLAMAYGAAILASGHRWDGFSLLGAMSLGNFGAAWLCFLEGHR